MKRAVIIAWGLLGLLSSLTSLFAAPETLSLAGSWQMRPAWTSGSGISERWFTQTFSEDSAVLPGTLQMENARTPPVGRPAVGENSDDGLGGPTTLHPYTGVVWFQREVEIPESWAGKHVELILERCMWETYVWIDDAFQGSAESLATPHVYDLSQALRPGRHRITIAVDNTNSKSSMSGASGTPVTEDRDVNAAMARFFNRYDRPGEQLPNNPDAKYDIVGHQVWSSGWIGIVGTLELRASDPIRIVSIKAFPSVKDGSVRLKIELENGPGVMTPAMLEVTCSPLKKQAGLQSLVRTKVELTGEKRQTIEQVVKISRPVLLWSEDTPHLYQADATIHCDNAALSDTESIRFGMHELSRKGNQFVVNGRTIFLRGENEALIFPDTVSPPMDVESWRRMMNTLKAYGFNHLRFHTCCPPGAAFEAADECGILMQVELPVVNTIGDQLEHADPDSMKFVSRELQRILDAYGNHPSFFSVSMGNEQANNLVSFRTSLVKFGREYDSRHFYAETTGTQARDPAVPLRGSEGDYFITAHPISGSEPLCGIEWGGGDVLHATRFNTRTPETAFDYSAGIEGLDKPVVSHEMGQWAVYPDLSEIPRYNGAQRAYNFELIRDRLEAKGMLAMAPMFTEASGRLALLLYKEEIESALRTPGMAGFQMLQMHDYPGQGTATVGLLNAFWNSKGLITPEEFRSFCSPVTPLARLPKRVYTNTERLTVEVDVANYGPTDLKGPVKWSLADDEGRTYGSGRFDRVTAPAGRLSSVGKIYVDLARVSAARKLVLAVDASVPGQMPNHWDLWVYPSRVSDQVPAGITVSTALDENTKALLRKGGKVLVIADPKELPPALNSKPGAAEAYKSRSGTFDVPIPGNFTPVFWTMMMKTGQLAQTMGLLCDPKHPALAGFPTEFHSNWQWWDPVMQSTVLQIDVLPRELVPIVGVIDNFRYNQRLAMIFEAKVGSGKLLVCSSDINTTLDKRPVARQLRRSLLDYMASSLFEPPVKISEEALDRVLLRSPKPSTDRPGWFIRCLHADHIHARHLRRLHSCGSTANISK